jgi:hypothetical protein
MKEGKPCSTSKRTISIFLTHRHASVLLHFKIQFSVELKKELLLKLSGKITILVNSNIYVHCTLCSQQNKLSDFPPWVHCNWVITYVQNGQSFIQKYKIFNIKTILLDIKKNIFFFQNVLNGEVLLIIRLRIFLFCYFLFQITQAIYT